MRVYNQAGKRICSHFIPEEDNPHKGKICGEPAVYACVIGNGTLADRCVACAEIFPKINRILITS